jgi:hypothetical protein
MAGSFKYKALFVHTTHHFCNAALFSTFFFNPHDVEFDILFRRLFGDNAASSDLYADLQRELKIYQVMGTISVLLSLSSLSNPEGYQLYSSTAYFLQTSFERVWALLEKGELSLALDVFGYEGLRSSEKSKIQQLIETHFVQACLPHLACMWYQLRAIFFLKGEQPKFGSSEEHEGNDVFDYMDKTLKHLEAHHLPEAATFKRECMEPLQQMKAHVERLFKEMPKRMVIRYTKERYRDRLRYELEGLSHSYRYAERGRRHTYFYLVPMSDEEKRQDIRIINAQLGREAGEERPSSPPRITML